jgi:hypothetical protein
LRPVSWSSSRHGITDVPLQGKRGALPFDVEDIPQRAAERKAGLSQPDGLDVGADEVFVRHIQPGRSHRTSHHQLGPLKEILIVWAKGRTVRKHQGRLATASSTSTTLRIVGWRGWYVAQIHDVEFSDVHTQLHGGGAIEDGQPSLAEGLLAGHTQVVLHLSRVFMGFKVLTVSGDGTVEVDEKGVGASTSRRGTRHANRVVQGM